MNICNIMQLPESKTWYAVYNLRNKMIVYEIHLRYVIRDKIQSETNSVRDKIQSKTKSENFFPFFFLSRKNSWILSRTEFYFRVPVHFFWVVSDKAMLIITKQYIHTAVSLNRQSGWVGAKSTWYESPVWYSQFKLSKKIDIFPKMLLANLGE